MNKYINITSSSSSSLSLFLSLSLSLKALCQQGWEYTNCILCRELQLTQSGVLSMTENFV